jgi:hypothetical protein
VATLLFAVGSLIIVIPTIASAMSPAELPTDGYPLPRGDEDRDDEPRARQEVGDHGEHHA